MNARFDWTTVHPAAYKAGIGMEESLKNSFLTPIQKELIKIRASQINACAFCLNMHTKDALKYGETPQRIFLLNAWRDAKELFTEEEQIILQITEEVTLIGNKGLSEETYQKAKVLFNENQLADIIMASVVINMWNRIAISTHMPIGK
ncbi:carboxymuconolactone decarboxylase family protein [Chryseobacterium shandongense]|uniref:Carboxymuconolactone decarboxylase family protein n=1 Tax=Chryseobacterium shandongense TaxID=1493872 RepID=A0AAD0YGD7_9FLAO|nr:carboxymuconolactone decarboxylase family protein [Chryseobacterium shandongense]AZA88424.1 carboxymuconolactone decarboxylase family protein [Chryseobacterium shandongense]AZA96967.1 carboxymuconolactone decarboxylase family protein [Chryseobacterium shandongense]